MVKEVLLPRDLGDGLILRQAAPGDTEPLVDFNRLTHREPGEEQPNGEAADFTRVLMSGRVPGVTVADFTMVEDTRARRIVSSLCLIVWLFAPHLQRCLGRRRVSGAFVRVCPQEGGFAHLADQLSLLIFRDSRRIRNLLKKGELTHDRIT